MTCWYALYEIIRIGVVQAYIGLITRTLCMSLQGKRDDKVTMTSDFDKFIQIKPGHWDKCLKKLGDGHRVIEPMNDITTF